MRSLRSSRVLLLATACLLIGGGSVGAEEKELTYKTPKGWKALQATQFLVLKFQVGDADAKSTFTVSQLVAPGGGLPANVNRWRNQVGLESLGEEEVLKSMQEKKIDGLKGHVVDLKGGNQRIMGAIVTRDKHVWFFKMMGPTDVVGKQKEAFEEFVSSVKFRKE